MRYLVAVSGGIDSVVLLHQLAKSHEHELIVAHFDHGIRSDSADDARFVAGLAEQYGLRFVTRREELGPQASEEQARDRRYEFLRKMAQKYQAIILTAHHSDDIIETIAINIRRGTGWRGAAVMQTPGIIRPLRFVAKTDIRAYALKHRLEWVEDSTNASDEYLRNRLRQKIASGLSSGKKKAVLSIWQRQLALKTAIDKEVAMFCHQHEYSRYYLGQIDDQSAIELLRGVVMTKTNASPTRPQLSRALIAVKTARPHTTFEIGAGVQLKFKTRTFIVETP